MVFHGPEGTAADNVLDPAGVRRPVRDKKAGRSSRGCSPCAMAGKCHTVSDKSGR